VFLCVQEFNEDGKLSMRRDQLYVAMQLWTKLRHQIVKRLPRQRTVGHFCADPPAAALDHAGRKVVQLPAFANGFRRRQLFAEDRLELPPATDLLNESGFEFQRIKRHGDGLARAAALRKYNESYAADLHGTLLHLRRAIFGIRI